jgi:type III pantothenate kinase
MLLAIDAGNTNVVFAVFEGDTKRGSWRIATDARRTSDEYAVWLMALMGMKGLTSGVVDAAILSSVVPAATPHLVRLCEDHFACTPMKVKDPDVDPGLLIKIDNPREAGADRIANAVGALAAHTPPLVVVDIGTGTTFDIIDAEGNFAGGIIAPGPTLALDALHRVASQLPKVDIRRPAQVIGKSTVGAMESGMFWGYTSMIEGLLTRIAAELSPTGTPTVTVIATGGLGRLFAEATPLIHHFDGEITLRGLLLIHARNRPGRHRTT